MNFLTEIKEGLSIAWDAIRANKMRSVLTTLGIVIGIVTVTLMGTAIDGMNRAFHKSVSIIGTDMLYVNRIGWFINSEAEWIKASKRRIITLDQVKAVARQMALARAVAPQVFMGQGVQYKDKSASRVQIIGTTDQCLITDGLSVAQGRFMSEAEAEGGRPVCVIGNDVATNLFGLESPLGKQIRVGARKLEVIGILERRGSFLGLQSLDNQIIIPIQQFLMGYWRNPDFTIEVKARSMAELEDAKEELRGIVRKIRRVAPGDPDDFAINQQEQFISRFNSVAGTIAAAGLLITGLSLFVGGIGIMNIMFVSVAERTREIGVRKAIGAKRRTILLQFLIEAATICLLGGLVGLGITYGLTLIVGRFFPVNMSIPVVGLAILVSLLTGVVSGFLPAWRAARMNPVDALRNE
ncbi:MAG TPA: ABC transporter permease [Verrucomicrobiae bacterium]|nr:ABC transporter permease [Verrucomicrobiae bacterium]